MNHFFCCSSSSQWYDFIIFKKTSLSWILYGEAFKIETSVKLPLNCWHYFCQLNNETRVWMFSMFTLLFPKRFLEFEGIFWFCSIWCLNDFDQVDWIKTKLLNLNTRVICLFYHSSFLAKELPLGWGSQIWSLLHQIRPGDEYMLKLRYSFIWFRTTLFRSRFETSRTFQKVITITAPFTKNW